MEARGCGYEFIVGFLLRMTGPPKEKNGYKARKPAFRLDDDSEATNWVLHKKGCVTVRRSKEKQAIFRR